ncbi:MAG TPA: hypothetical protein PKH92_15140 [Anaerolineaceae bacterium]|nr:hypothetical protein [Anaerolineaceae bacterium]HNZ13950.1 hypothetical protein [Anaerolineaceae bacterium]HOD06380.1 hypothetical protein [Anaerolineaceae bacterium]HQF62685.1 hypothetical protein [Anaerolineaceae bacterium]HQH86843.1 hypothetical protein [Anaerolineaceae bacterium]
METRTLILFLSELVGAIAVTLLLTLSPRFKRGRAVQFARPRQEGLFGLGVAVLLGLAAYAFLRGPGASLTYDETTLAGLGVRLGIGAAALLVVALILRLRKHPLSSVRWSRPMLMPGVQLGLAVGFLTLFLRNILPELFKGITMDQGYALLVWLGIALAEESLFRGYVQLRLEAWLGERWGWLAASGLSTLWLLLFIGGQPLSALLPRLGLLLLQALVLGWMAQRSRGVLGGAIYRAMSGWLMMF